MDNYVHCSRPDCQSPYRIRHYLTCTNCRLVVCQACAPLELRIIQNSNCSVRLCGACMTLFYPAPYYAFETVSACLTETAFLVLKPFMRVSEVQSFCKKEKERLEEEQMDSILTKSGLIRNKKPVKKRVMKKKQVL